METLLALLQLAYKEGDKVEAMLYLASYIFVVACSLRGPPNVPERRWGVGTFAGPIDIIL